MVDEGVVMVPSVLVVEHEPGVRDTIVRALRGRCGVSAVVDEPAALAAIERAAYDLVVADLAAPCGNDRGPLARLRGELCAAGKRIIAIANDAAQIDRVEDREAWIADYLVKPFCEHEVAARCATQIELSSIASERNALVRREHDIRVRLDTKNEFLAMLGHELRNPLSSIATTLQVMRLRGAACPEIDLLERQVRHLSRLIDDLLDVSRIARGKLELRRADVEVSELVERALELTRELLESPGHRVYTNVVRHGLELHVDPDRIIQVISNLIANAAKYSDPGSRIEIDAARTPDAVRITVRDHGVGIAPELIDRVFDAFVQQPQTMDRSRGGLGLGLAIVRRITEAHGGRVSVVSTPGSGSEFTIVLPVSPHPSHGVRDTRIS